jgi:hypothetical protein
LSAPTAADPVLVLVKDLLLSSRVTASATAAGLTCRVVRDPTKLAAQPGNRLFADLNLPGAIEAATQWRAATGRPVIGFAAHVDPDILRAARQAGLDRVLTRGQIVQVLDALLVEEIALPGDNPAG